MRWIGLLWVVGLPTAAWASVFPEQALPAGDGTRLSIELTCGSVEVTGESRKDVVVSGEAGRAVRSVKLVGKGASLSVVVDVPNHTQGNEGCVDLRARVPAGIDLAMEVVSAPVTVTGVRGVIDHEGVAGPFVATGVAGVVRVESVSGSVVVEGPSPDVDVEAVSGAVTIRGVRGGVSVESVSGAVTVEGELGRTEISVVSGSVDVDAAALRGPLEVEAHSGSVTLRLPRADVGEVSVETFSGAIVNELVDATVQRGFGPGASLTHDGPGAEVEAFAGEVRLLAR